MTPALTHTPPRDEREIEAERYGIPITQTVKLGSLVVLNKNGFLWLGWVMSIDRYAGTEDVLVQWTSVPAGMKGGCGLFKSHQMQWKSRETAWEIDALSVP